MLIAAAIGVVVYWIVSGVVRNVVKRTSWAFPDLLYGSLRRPARLGIPLFAVIIARARQRISAESVSLPAFDRALQLAAIAIITWFVAASVTAIVNYIKAEHPLNVADNSAARRVHTQVTVIGRSLQVLIVIGGLAAALIDAIKQAAREIVESSPLRDKRAFAAQVTDITDKSVQLRILVSAADASKAFDLRVYVREKLLEHVRREHPGSLPLQRLQLPSPDTQSHGGFDLLKSEK